MNSLNSNVRKWQLLGVYNFYRLGLIIIFFTIYCYEVHAFKSGFIPVSLVLFIYAILTIVFFILFYIKKPLFSTQVMIAGILDLLFLTLLITPLANIQAGLTLLLNVNVAILSILAPGRMAIFYASIASFFLFGVKILEFFSHPGARSDILFYTGLHGASFFATAIVAWYLAKWVKSSEELAARRMAEIQELAKINEYIVARLHAGIIYADQEQNIKLINDAAKRFFKVDFSNVPETLEEVSPILAKKFELFYQKQPQSNTAGQTNLSDLQLKVHFYFASQNRKGGVFVFIDDLSSVTQTAQQLKLAALGRFTASIAHELRNPLGAIAHASQLLGEKNTLDLEDQRLREMIVSNCNRMNIVIKNILQLSRREQSAPQQIDIISFLAKFAHNFKMHNDCDIVLEETGKQKALVNFDPSQLEQILVNLCENALLHGQRGEERIQIVFNLEMSSMNCQLFVQDNGKGINIENKEEVFEPFFSTANRGTGMGLFIAKDLCEINQAQLRVLANNPGACFVIHFSQSNEIVL